MKTLQITPLKRIPPYEGLAKHSDPSLRMWMGTGSLCPSYWCAILSYFTDEQAREGNYLLRAIKPSFIPFIFAWPTQAKGHWHLFPVCRFMRTSAQPSHKKSEEKKRSMCQCVHVHMNVKENTINVHTFM